MSYANHSKSKKKRHYTLNADVETTSPKLNTPSPAIAAKLHGVG